MTLENRRNELRTNFLEFHYGMQRPNSAEAKVFEYHGDNSGRIILPTDSSLISEVERLRKRIYFPLRMRGTASHFMDDAKQAGVLSSKRVDAWYEGDVGSIATYRIPTADQRLSNEEFLYKLQLTTTAAVQYGMNHGDWNMALLNERPLRESVPDAKDRLTAGLPGTRYSISEGVDVAVCYEESEEQRKRQPLAHYLNLGLRTTGNFSVLQEGDLSERSGYENIRLWDKSVSPFRERGFKSYEDIQEHSPLYMGVTKQDVLDILAEIDTEGSRTRSLAHFMRQGADSPYDYGYLKDTVNYLLAEKLTLELLSSLKSLQHKNDHQLQFTD